MTKSFQIENALSRALLIAACLLFTILVFFFVKWCAGDVIAARAPAKEIAELGVDLAPNDPQTHYALAVINGKNFSAEDSAKSLAGYERAVALSPHDYRLWLAYGKARERGGDAAGAEFAVKKALELAPNYAPVQWAFANVILRRGRMTEAFAEMLRAAENDKNFRLPLIATAWQVFDGDLESVRRSIGDSPAVNPALANFLVRQKRFDEAVQIWNTLPAEEKKSIYKTDGEQLYSELIAAKKFRSALQIRQSLDDKPEAERYAVGQIFNGGFEMTAQRGQTGVFDWQIADGNQPQIGPNEEQKHGGDRSLFMIFDSLNGRDFRQITQTVAVESAKKYTFEVFYKAELKTAATLRWEITDAADGKILASTNPISAEADWTELSAAFTTAANTEAVTIRLARETCKAIVCPITGKVRFDDFSLKE
jgi:tetratricopeptide (TPR) repeat protein